MSCHPAFVSCGTSMPCIFCTASSLFVVINDSDASVLYHNPRYLNLSMCCYVAVPYLISGSVYGLAWMLAGVPSYCTIHYLLWTDSVGPLSFRKVCRISRSVLSTACVCAISTISSANRSIGNIIPKKRTCVCMCSIASMRCRSIYRSN